MGYINKPIANQFSSTGTEMKACVTLKPVLSHNN